MQSNLRQGFCAQLRLQSATVQDWQLRLDAPGASRHRNAQGYQVCVARSGRHSLSLQHRFAARTPEAPTGLAWPVLTEFSAL